MVRRWLLAMLWCGCALVVLPVQAAITKLVVFGDSNVDNGNLFALSGGLFNQPPNFQGRNSNGILVVEYAAQALAVPLEDYAVSGARSGLLNAIQIGFPAIDNSGALSQINSWISNVLPAQGGAADPNALYVFWAGSNDLIGATSANLQSRIDIVKANLATAMGLLDGAGAEHILVATRTPRAALNSANDLFGQALNAEIRSTVAALDLQFGADIEVFDAYALIADMMSNPGVYGFTQVGPLCIEDAACRSDPQVARGWVNWDAAHKTTRVHELLAEAMLRQIPEPSVALLLAVALLLMVAQRRRTHSALRPNAHLT